MLIVYNLIVSISYAQSSTSIQLSKKNLIYVKLSNVTKFSLYENPTTLEKKCGYYSNNDSCFYKCNGQLITKVSPENILDGTGCCQKRDDLMVDFRLLNDSSRWKLSDFTYFGMVEGNLLYKNIDDVIFIMKLNDDDKSFNKLKEGKGIYDIDIKKDSWLK